MGQTQEVRGVATNISAEDGITTIRYHQTAVVKFTGKQVILDSGGWRTATTKTRMNQASNQFDLNYGVYQENGDWFVNLPNGETVPFVDGLIITRQ